MFTILSLAATASVANPLLPWPVAPGSDSDEYGCVGSAGFSWCEVLGQCVQTWITPCEKNELEVIEVHELEPLPTADALPPCPSCCPFCKSAACGMSHCQAKIDPGFEKLPSCPSCCPYWKHAACEMSHCLANPYPPCEDEGEHCSYWEKQGHCNDGYATYMKENCKKSCDTYPGTTQHIPTQFLM